MRGTPCSWLREKTARSYQRARKRWGRKREGGARAGHRLPDERTGGCRARGNDGFHLPIVWWMGNISDAFAAVPGLTPCGPRASPSRLSHHYLLAFSLSAVSPGLCQKGFRAGVIRLSHSRRRTAERSCLMRDTRIDGSKNGHVCFPVGTGNRMELAANRHRCQNLRNNK